MIMQSFQGQLKSTIEQKNKISTRLNYSSLLVEMQNSGLKLPGRIRGIIYSYMTLTELINLI